MLTRKRQQYRNRKRTLH